MSVVAKLQRFLHEERADETLIDLIPSLAILLPPRVKFEQDTWDLLAWKERKGSRRSFNVHFHKFKNEELKTLAKIYALEKRQRLIVKPSSIKAELDAIIYLDKALCSRPLRKSTNAVFFEAQDLIGSKFKSTAAPRTANYLMAFGRWLASNLGYRISYKSTLTTIYAHGRKATDEDRDNKLIDNRILFEMVAANQRKDLIDRDRFYLSAFIVLVGTGFRIGEWATLPKDCLVVDDENIGIRFFPEKKSVLAVRPPFPDWAPAVEDAIEKLIKLTDTGRESVAALRLNPGFDWPLILQDKEATEYFVAKFCHEWTANPLHNMFNKDGAWWEKGKRYVDAIKLVEEAGSQVKAAKTLGVDRSNVAYFLKAQNNALCNKLPPKFKGGGKEKRTTWDTDSRVISIQRLEEHADLKIKAKSREHFAHIIEDARENYQLKGEVYPSPPFNKALEESFRRVIHPVVEKNGKALLQPENALLVTLQYQLSDSYDTKPNQYSLITDKELSRWFCGEKRSLGTKKPEDSCFSRLGIIDPKTGEIAKFTSHDIRHWLNTYLQEGGMANDKIALLFNRDPSQNHTYDQTSSKTRLNNMREAIRDGGAMGHVADTYDAIAEYSREEAEQYLEACTLQLNLMPHGGCSLNWGMEACPHHNGCFNGKDGVCEHLCFDPSDLETKAELDIMASEAETALRIIPEESPQYSHYKNIQQNLKEIGGVDNA